MDKQEQLQRVLDRGIVAIIRAPSGEALIDVARALVDGGIDVLEVTFTVPGALRVVEQVADSMGDQVLLGAGTVLDSQTARSALLAGAEFIVSPAVRTDVIQLCQRYDKLVMPGALTPTEVLAAWEAGADIVKVFPADVGGPSYLKALHGPLPQIRLMPTGGVDLESMSGFLDAGACALGLGGALVSSSDIAKKDFAQITSKARSFVAKIEQFKSE